MEKRTIKVNGKKEQVSLLGFGCMRFPQKDGEIDEKLAREMMMYAIDNGVNYIDTAYPYHNGKSELFVKEVIRELDRESFFLADKLPIWDCHNKEDVDRIFQEQLNKCGVNYFDFYLIHAVNKDRIQQVKDLDLFNIVLIISTRVKQSIPFRLLKLWTDWLHLIRQFISSMSILSKFRYSFQMFVSSFVILGKRSLSFILYLILR